MCTVSQSGAHIVKTLKFALTPYYTPLIVLSWWFIQKEDTDRHI